MRSKEYTLTVGGVPLSFAFTDLADQAGGSVFAKAGDTAVLATATMGKEKFPLDYFPLLVDYQEKFYSSGHMPGSRYIRREGKPSDEAIVTGRLIDRAIRPLFDQTLRREIHIVLTVLAIGDYDPDVVALNAASLALAASDIPWRGPVAAVRVGMRAGKIELNAPYSLRDDEVHDLDLVVAGKDGKLVMLEGGGNENAEEDVVAALAEAKTAIASLETFFADVLAHEGKPKKDIPTEGVSPEMLALFTSEFEAKLREAAFSKDAAADDLKSAWLLRAKTSFGEKSGGMALRLYEKILGNILHAAAVLEGRRADGRDLEDVRPISAMAGGISDMLHGVGIFYRGGTHVLAVLTLGRPDERQLIDGPELREEKRFMFHYNFPPFSAGAPGRIVSPNRREVGHGALAERALAPMLPDAAAFPHAIRIVAESLASNGSTSMASVCAGTLALMDGGVQIKAPVAGVAIGLMEHGGESVLLSDIGGPEDHHGDMDFKIAGTRSGITALQLDVKVDGIAYDVAAAALARGKTARLLILDTMHAALAAPRPELSPRAPQVGTISIPPEKIGLLIGPGGKTVNRIKRSAGVQEISIEQSGRVVVVGGKNAVQKALREIERTLLEAPQNNWQNRHG